ncbi:unnamed protein product [Acanthosepion pharaonis]|uniref:Uncharacterized protein n=1 Tax=Acanthosepion pharaonis TaxID=158019 RepID=A0A812ALV2_ACAPH|nr:unnamed protein product [Sepia pharaonis]
MCLKERKPKNNHVMSTLRIRCKRQNDQKINKYPTYLKFRSLITLFLTLSLSYFHFHSFVIPFLSLPFLSYSFSFIWYRSLSSLSHLLSLIPQIFSLSLFHSSPTYFYLSLTHTHISFLSFISSRLSLSLLYIYFAFVSLSYCFSFISYLSLSSLFFLIFLLTHKFLSLSLSLSLCVFHSSSTLFSFFSTSFSFLSFLSHIFFAFISLPPISSVFLTLSLKVTYSSHSSLFPSCSLSHPTFSFFFSVIFLFLFSVYYFHNRPNFSLLLTTLSPKIPSFTLSYSHHSSFSLSISFSL